MILLKRLLLCATALSSLAATASQVLEEECKIVFTYDMELIIGIGSSDSSQVCSQLEQQYISGTMKDVIKTALEATGRLLKDERTGFGYTLSYAEFKMCVEAFVHQPSNSNGGRRRIRSLSSANEETGWDSPKDNDEQRRLLGHQYIYRGGFNCGFHCDPDNKDERRNLNACNVSKKEISSASQEGWRANFEHASVRHFPILGDFIGPFGSVSTVSRKFQVYDNLKEIRESSMQGWLSQPSNPNLTTGSQPSNPNLTGFQSFNPDKKYIVMEFSLLARPALYSLSGASNRLTLQIGRAKVLLLDLHKVGIYSGPSDQDYQLGSAYTSWERRTYFLKNDNTFDNTQLHLFQIVVQYGGSLTDSDGQIEITFDQMKFDGNSAYLGDIKSAQSKHVKAPLLSPRLL